MTTMTEALRAEAAIDPDPVPVGAAKKETQIIAIYGKGGIGKSFTLSNLSYMVVRRSHDPDRRDRNPVDRDRGR